MTTLDVGEISVQRRTAKGELLVNVLLDDVVEYAVLAGDMQEKTE